MREIKFRAWDNKQKEMLFMGDYPTDEAVMQLMDIDWEGLGILFCGNIIACDECGRFVYLQNDRYVLMQFTGLKDKNGKEIYEGDIISYSISQTQHYKGSIIWYDTGFSCNVFYHKHDKWALGKGFEHTYIEPQLMNFSSDCIDIKVIGNIYEIPSF